MSEKYLDITLSATRRAQALLQEMSLDEKMAQVVGYIHFGEDFGNYDEIEKAIPFGVGEVGSLEMRRIESLEEAAIWQRKVQEIVMKNSPHHIPAIFHMEGLCGAFIQDTTSFPSGIGRI